MGAKLRSSPTKYGSEGLKKGPQLGPDQPRGLSFSNGKCGKMQVGTAAIDDRT